MMNKRDIDSLMRRPYPVWFVVLFGLMGIQTIQAAWNEWGVRVADFFKQLVDAVDTPYAPSPVIAGVAWAPPSDIVRLAQGSDNWPLTQADNDRLYTAYGDGHGFAPFVPEKLSLGLAEVRGTPPHVQGLNIRSKSGEQYGDGARGKKASAMLMYESFGIKWKQCFDLSP